MTVQTWVGRFCVTEAGVQEEGRWLTSLVRQHADEPPDELYVIVEPATEASAELTAQVVDVVAQLYARDTLSITGAILRALQSAHEHLRDWNKRSLREHHVGAGATCLAVRGADAYLAQVGPSLAYVCRAAGDVRRVAPDNVSADAALGMPDVIEPHVTRVHMEPGDCVLIASSRFDHV
ncbi:MAG TPA: PP2C family serine/threonine-protein phosphatase, partial [Dehalococcoidia bacterium]|nr:PP2C family serine/threonine-protein phosphatase [Dehalococcoidia bacterium]